ncbi:Sad1 / UNC-like C-terminal [Teratosphaeria destructans]|uniref:Sad1 / UNC-like C-terminal n=1 Tax=Teratosphaeria destructans TaxID=418781 RepID=A0A9W7W331_9PEZI|nr:Sad1 / UNC-like C-terminal [Teratosphaeria destructans]
MLLLLRSTVLWLLISSSTISRAESVDNGSGIPATTAAPPAYSASGSTSIGTCISRTVNYITHILPQQCLRADRTISSSAQSQTVDTDSSASSDPGNGVSISTTGEGPSSTAAIETSLSANDGAAVQSKASPPLSVATIEPEPEEESPLDNANFLSFEEWKAQNLAKAGQSPEHIGQEGLVPRDRQRPGIHNALDTLGEENEIDLGFSGFGGARGVSSASTSTSQTSSETSLQSTSPNTLTLRSKDAGKTCKERNNYASFDCAAGIMKSNPECKSSSSILVENKDSYMLNVCSAPNKFFIVELCNDILIDTIVLANYEFFSSVFRHFRVSVADRYPVKPDKWKDLGTFEARNTREVQAFLVENPLIWARYVRIEFLSHYGNEYYCPLSLLRVHGTTMMEEFRHQEELARGEIAEDEPLLEAEVPPTKPVQQEPLPSTDDTSRSTVEAIPPVQTEILTGRSTAESTGSSTEVVSGSSSDAVGPGSPDENSTTSTGIVQTAGEPEASDLTCATSKAAHDPMCSPSSQALTASAHGEPAESASHTVVSSASSFMNSTVASEPEAIASYSLDLGNTSDPVSVPATSSVSAVDSNTDIVRNTTTAVSVQSHHSTSMSQDTSLSVTDARTDATKATSATSTASHPPQPTTQESFFKSVHKRLQQLESNSTLSLQYIEEQSRILRDAFTKVEKRQVAATGKFLSHLNNTVMNELHGFRQAYDQLWQSTVIELEGQREQYQREMLALSTRLTLVADELVWQKRMGIVQSTLLLLCLGLVLFARQGNGYLEMPLAQQLVHKSQAAFRTGWESEANSPSPVSRSPVSLFRRRLWRTRSEEVRSVTGTDGESRADGSREGEGPDVLVLPPTPTLDEGAWESGEDEEEEYGEVSEEPEGMQSGPATPNGRAEGLKRLPGDIGALIEGGDFGGRNV